MNHGAVHAPDVITWSQSNARTSLLSQVLEVSGAAAQAGSTEDGVTLMNCGEEDIPERPRHHCQCASDEAVRRVYFVDRVAGR